MVDSVLKKHDELIRCTNVLTDGIQFELTKILTQQENNNKRWKVIDEENHDTKKYLAKFKAEKDKLEAKLRQAKHQLDIEAKKRVKAEQEVDHLTRQLQLIRELLLDKDANSQSRALAQSMSISRCERTLQSNESESSLHGSEDSRTNSQCSSNGLVVSDYDVSGNDVMLASLKYVNDR